MKRPTVFLISIGLAILFFSLSCHSQKEAPLFCQNATIIYTNATFITLDPKQPVASAVAVSKQRLLAVGNSASLIKNCRGQDTQVIDLQGAFVVPGFIDTYSKFLLYGWLSQNAVDFSTTNIFQRPDWREIKTIDAFLNALKNKTPNAAGWLIVNGYDPVRITGSALNQTMLNNLQSNTPTLVLYASGNQALLNQAAIQKLATFDNNTQIAVDNNGFIRDTALITLLTKLINKEDIPKVIQQAVHQYTEQGYTTVTETMFNPTWISAYEQLTLQPEFAVDVILMPSTIAEKKRMDLTYQDLPRLYVGPVLFKVDGAAQDDAAFLTRPVLQPNLHSNNRWPESLTKSPRELEQLLKTADREKIPVALECNGDAAIDLALNIINKMRNLPNEQPFNAVIINAPFVRSDQLQRMRQLNVKVSWFAPHFYYWGAALCNIFRDAEGNYYTNPLANTKKIMTTLSVQANSPTTPPVPLQMIKFINTGELQNWQPNNPKCSPKPPAKSSVNITDAIKALTLDAAVLYGLENDKGSLVPGKLADMTILNENPLKSNLQNIHVLGTISRGVLHLNNH